ncbi:hypothetical protein [Tolypothrix sp. VBCCA 56010]|uniref:hypothetical protein n=1 Tax=Tolypothrix sp. VBCCA 56010 TaxID=3137731 RepID=UPI003D7DE05B
MRAQNGYERSSVQIDDGSGCHILLCVDNFIKALAVNLLHDNSRGHREQAIAWGKLSNKIQDSREK